MPLTPEQIAFNKLPYDEQQRQSNATYTNPQPYGGYQFEKPQDEAAFWTGQGGVKPYGI